VGKLPMPAGGLGSLGGMEFVSFEERWAASAASTMSEKQQLAKLADRLVPASTKEVAAMNQAHAQTIAVEGTPSDAGGVAHELLGAKGPKGGIDFGISETGTLETGVIKELKTHWGGPMEMRQFTKTDEQLLKASRDFQQNYPGIVPLRIQYHLYRDPTTGTVLRLNK